MEKQVIVRERQRFLSSDIMDLQSAVRTSFDKLIRAAVGPGSYYDGLAASATGQWEVTLAPGNLFLNGAMYRSDVSTVFSDALYNVRPIAQKRFVAVIGYGQNIESTESGAPAEPRQFVVNTTTRETQVRQVSTRSVRHARIEIISGEERAQPIAPVPGAGNVLIATVLLGTNGIEAIAMNAAALLPQSLRNSMAIAQLSEFVDVLGLRVATLISDQAALKAGLADTVRRAEFDALRARADEAFETAMRALAIGENLDTGAQFLRDFENDYSSEVRTDKAGAGYSAQIGAGGLTFPAGSSATATNGVETFYAVEPKVTIHDDLMLPAYTHRLAIDTFGEGKVARQAALQSFTPASHAAQATTAPVSSWAYGRTKNYKHYLAAPDGFKVYHGVLVDSATLRDIPLTAASIADARSYALSKYQNGDFLVHSIRANIGSHHGMPVMWIYIEASTGSAKVGEYEAGNGLVIDGQGRAETWLQERDGWLTRVGLFFAAKGAAGDVKLLVTEVDASGAPDLKQAPAIATVAYADIIAASETTVKAAGIETVVDITPMLCRGGRRYAINVLSPGAHVVRMTEGVSAITQGEHWALTDANKYERPALESRQTMAMRLYFARFATTRIEVDLKPLSLAGGIQDVDVTSRGVVPALTRLAFEVQPDGGAWKVLGPGGGQQVEADLSGLPELLPFRVIFEGTLDVMPALSRGSTKSTVEVSRPALSFTHYSSVIDVGSGSTATEVKVIHRLRSFDDDDADFTVTLVTDPGGSPSTEAADAVVDEVLPDGSVSRTSVFDLSAGKQTFQIKEAGTASALASLYSVERVYAAFYNV